MGGRGGFFVLGLPRSSPKRIGPWVPASGSTLISTAIYAATTAVCVRLLPRPDENWGSSVYSASRAKQPRLASKKSSSPEASRFCWKISAKFCLPALQPLQPQCSPTECCSPDDAQQAYERYPAIE